MKIIFAGNTGTESRELMICDKKAPRLFSYYFVQSDFFNSKQMMDIAKNKVELFLDSGAFSAKSQGIDIDIDEYISFIKKNKSYIHVYANLDVIGNPKASLNNLRKMEKAGLHPLPVYHFGEDAEKYLVPLIEKYEYICIGGMVKSGDLYSFLDRIFADYICNTKTGLPKVKVHGFGLTSLKMMLRYPWYSVDSTSWVVTGRMGSVYIPRFKNGNWIYDENSWKIAVSNRSPNMKEAGKHFTTMSPKEKEIFLNYIHKKGYKMGKSEIKKVPMPYELQENERWMDKKEDRKKEALVEVIVEPGISNKYQLRDEMNIIYFQDLENSMPEWPWSFVKNKTHNTLGL